MIGLVLVNHIWDSCPECLSQGHCQLGFIASAPFAPDRSLATCGWWKLEAVLGWGGGDARRDGKCSPALVLQVSVPSLGHRVGE